MCLCAQKKVLCKKSPTKYFLVGLFLLATFVPPAAWNYLCACVRLLFLTSWSVVVVDVSLLLLFLSSAYYGLLVVVVRVTKRNGCVTEYLNVLLTLSSSGLGICGSVIILPFLPSLLSPSYRPSYLTVVPIIYTTLVMVHICGIFDTEMRWTIAIVIIIIIIVILLWLWTEKLLC